MKNFQVTFKDTVFVLVQLVLLVLFFTLPGWRHFYVRYTVMVVGWIVAISGVLIIAWASINLGRSISPFPTPLEKATLVTNGVFRYIRHPIYTGFIIFLAGIAVATGSLTRIGITLFSALFFSVKASYEEKKLLKKYPGYSHYKERAGRFIPKLKSLFSDND